MGKLSSKVFRVRIVDNLDRYTNPQGEYLVSECEVPAYYKRQDCSGFIVKKDCEIVVDTPQPRWYELDPAVFDELVNEPQEFRKTMLSHNKMLWESFCFVHEDAWDEKTDLTLDVVYMLRLYRDGIIRQGGAIPEKGVLEKFEESGKKLQTALWETAFSVKNGTMEVDWDKLLVTKENALGISIASWKFAYLWMQENGEMVERGAGECALCKLYLWEYTGQHKCKNCAVRKETGHSGCITSPYGKFKEATDLHEAQDACRNEIEFLESLQTK